MGLFKTTITIWSKVDPDENGWSLQEFYWAAENNDAIVVDERTIEITDKADIPKSVKDVLGK